MTASKESIRKIVLWIFIILILMIFLGSCAPTQGYDEVSDPPGFLYGLWHGFIILFTFIASFFTDYEVYAFPNNGGWYNFGFLLGVMIFFGGGGNRVKK